MLFEEHGGHFCGKGGEKQPLDLFQRKAGHALHQLQHDIAGKAVSHEHIAAASRNFLALNIADKIQRGIFQKPIGFHINGRPLMRLGAVVEQTDGDMRILKNAFHIDGAHIGKLLHIFRGDGGICAAVKQKQGPLKGQNRADGGAAEAAIGANDRRSPCKQRACIARADKGIALSRGKHAQPDGHRGIALFAQNIKWGVLHGDHLRGMADLNAGAEQLFAAANGKLAADGCLISHQNNIHILLLHGEHGAGNERCGGVVSAHGIYDDFHDSSSFARESK